MPAAMSVIKKLLAFILCFVFGTLIGNAIVIGTMIAGGKNFAQGETFSIIHKNRAPRSFRDAHLFYVFCFENKDQKALKRTQGVQPSAVPCLIKACPDS